ncbi:MAG: chemotaxis protein CheW [Nitrospinae bacterium]|nr:chemotaxis protein CheW [Nitrospinota bacterium]
MADDALMNEFFADTQSHIEGVEEDLLALEKAPGDSELIADIFRRVHSVKGNAGMLGLSAIHTTGQEFETFLDGVRDRGAATEAEIERMFHSLDRLKQVVAELRGDSSVKGPAVEEIPAPAPPVAAMPAAAKPAPPIAAPRAAAPAAKPAATAPAGAASAAAQEETFTFLTFVLGEETYGIDILRVREIITSESITRVPNTKKFLEGVMNLRDQIIPVFNLKGRLDIDREKMAVGGEKNIIIVEISRVATGLKVDEVTGIKVFPRSKISPPETFYGSVPTEYLYGVGQTDAGPVILLAAGDLCNPDELLY